MPHHTQPRGQTATKYILCAVSVMHITLATADTVYRCGDSYSPLASCAHGVATEVDFAHERTPNAMAARSAAASDLQEAQNLEKQRRQAERLSNLTVPLRITPPVAPATAASQPVMPPYRHTYARRPVNPYFTAVDPTSRPAKKSTANAVPATKP